MPLSPAFSITESTQLGVVVLTDTSTGTDASVTGRRVRIYKTDGSLFVEEQNWDINETTITLTILDKDYALNFEVYWDYIATPGVYTADLIFAFTRFGKFEYGQLVRLMTSNPDIIKDRDFFDYMKMMDVDIENAVFAIDEMEDQYAAQRAIERYQDLITKKSIFY